MNSNTCALCAKTAASLSDLEKKLAALRAAIAIGDDMDCPLAKRIEALVQFLTAPKEQP